MKRPFVAPVLAGVMLLCAPKSAPAQSFSNCYSDCQRNLSAMQRLCVGKMGDLLRSCQQRASATFTVCSNRCTDAENTRLRLMQAREQEAAERRRLRGQTEPPRPH